ncbi:hypothetical protein D3C71_1784590 [compost metagenome]
MVASIDFGRFLQRFRNSLEESNQNDEVERADQIRQHERPGGVDESQITDQQIFGNHAAAEEHRDDDNEHEQAFPAQTRFRERVCRQNRHQHTGNGRDQRKENRIG